METSKYSVYPKYACSFTYTWTEHVHEVHTSYMERHKLNKNFSFYDKWKDAMWGHVSRNLGKCTLFCQLSNMTTSDPRMNCRCFFLYKELGGESISKMAASYSLESCHQSQIPSISSCCECTLAKNLGQSVLNC